MPRAFAGVPGVSARPRRARRGAPPGARLRALAPGALLLGILLPAASGAPAGAEEPPRAGGSAPSRPEARPAPPAVLDALLPAGRLTRRLDALSDEELAPDEAFRVRELGRDAHTSHHLVWIRDREEPHRHDRHELLVVILRGHGSMRLGDETRPVGEGSILYVPRGTPHAFANAAQDPAVAYVVYTPSFDGKDRQPVE